MNLKRVLAFGLAGALMFTGCANQREATKKAMEIRK